MSNTQWEKAPWYVVCIYVDNGGVRHEVHTTTTDVDHACEVCNRMNEGAEAVRYIVIGTPVPDEPPKEWDVAVRAPIGL